MIQALEELEYSFETMKPGAPREKAVCTVCGAKYKWSLIVHAFRHSVLLKHFLRKSLAICEEIAEFLLKSCEELCAYAFGKLGVFSGYDLFPLEFCGVCCKFHHFVVIDCGEVFYLYRPCFIVYLIDG